MGKIAIEFYDLESMLNVPPSVANGYIIILAGGTATASALDAKGRVARSKVEKDAADSTVLGFLALTEGNVIDTCFGLSTVASKASPGVKHVTKLKSLLMAAADEKDEVRQLAVDTFRGSFEILLQHQGKRARLNWFTRCFTYGKLIRETRAQLERAFEELTEVVQECTRD
jgi:hypothetical protein